MLCSFELMDNGSRRSTGLQRERVCVCVCEREREDRRELAHLINDCEAEAGWVFAS